MKNLLLFSAFAMGMSLGASAQASYEQGNPSDAANYGYLQNFRPLKEYVDYQQYPNFHLGIAIAANDYLAGGNVKAVANNYFTEVVTGNAMKMSSCVSSSGSMNFTTVKNFVNSASAANLNIYGHTLAWHSQQATGYLNNLIKDRKPEKVDGNATAWVQIAAKDFTTDQSIGWCGDREKYGFTTDFDSDGLHVTTTKKCNSWEVQYIAMSNIPTEAGETYRMTMRIRASAAGTMHCKLGDWSSGPNTSFAFGTEWKDAVVTFTKCLDGSFLLLQHGDFVGELWVKSVKFEQAVSCNEVTEARRCLVVEATDRVANSWDNQFWILAGNFSKGDKYEFSAEVRADQNASASTQIHTTPGSYVDYVALGNVPFTGEWATVTASGTFNSAGSSIAFNLSELAAANKYYFDNISLKVNGVERVTNGSLEGTDVSSFAWKQYGGGVQNVTISDGITYLQIPQPIPLTMEEKHDILVDAMGTWIGGIMNATQGKVKAWDVVNEAISGGDTDGDGYYDLQHEGSSDCFYWPTHMGDLEYVRQAVRLAREHYAEAMEAAGSADDGRLTLFINDYNLESDWDNNKKLRSLIEWIRRWEADGVTRIDGIGSQMHISCYMNASTQQSKKKAIENSFKLMAASGKLVRISELDMGMVDASGNDVPTAQVTEEMHQKMADLYEWIIKKYFEIIPAEQQWGICQWCATDSPTNSGWRADSPVGLWTLNWYRKHTYAGFARGLGANADGTGGIANVAVDLPRPADNRIFDLMGRYRGTSTEGLPAGIYIINGRKIAIP